LRTSNRVKSQTQSKSLRVRDLWTAFQQN
jgi:hypothetical protein